jgi:putative nucleotidyltransferase with HDIG domain
VYCVTGLLWLLLTDAAIRGVGPRPADLTRAQMITGLAFIFLTGGLIYVLARRDLVAQERAREHLVLSYDATLEWWTRALDMRDRSTTDHSVRVTVMTVRLAAALGVAGEELEHVRRGALLHDIGKMAVPDAILQKPGPLTEDEWAVMRQHPLFARQLLEPIEFLRPALPIPVWHHERWDGTGYPDRLVGEAIPLPARIFAVVDVWDALTHDRPYRRAWPVEKVRDHLRALAGTHLDPTVVEAFLKLLAEDAVPTAVGRLR